MWCKWLQEKVYTCDFQFEVLLRKNIKMAVQMQPSVMNIKDGESFEKASQDLRSRYTVWSLFIN